MNNNNNNPMKIMQFSTFFFTGTGNTWWAAREFSKIAKELGHNSEYYSIEKQKTHEPDFLKEILTKSDVIVIAYPIYESSLPAIMRSFLKELSNIYDSMTKKIKKIGITITTVALFSGDGALVPRKVMKKSGLILQGAINLQMASNLGIPYFNYNPVSPTVLERRKIRNRKKLKKLVERIGLGKKYLEGRNPLLFLVGLAQRVGEKIFNKHIYKIFTIDLNSCNRCLLCVNNCPTRSIEYKDDNFIFHKGCTCCFRCYNFCPTYSISILNRNADPKKFRRFRGPGEGFSFKLVKDN